MPIAISVNMFRLRLTIDCQPRSKKGHPAQSTTGVARASCIQFEVCGPRRNTGTASPRPIQKRRVMSRNSALGPVSPVAISGSRAMPQIGQFPGAGRLIWGCIGQV